MNGFFVSLIFFGILLVIVSLIIIFLDKKKVFQFMKSFDDKKQELTEIISDAEEMIEELNKFSDYIVGQMDRKNDELNKSLSIAEEKVNLLGNRLDTVSKKAAEAVVAERSKSTERFKSVEQGKSAVLSRSLKQSKPVECNKTEERSIITETAGVQAGQVSTEEIQAGTISSNIAVNGDSVSFGAEEVETVSGKSDNVIPFNSKYSEVIRLSNQGLQSLEIAKILALGKGEVDLILDLRK